jgi:hypothetical protein
MGCRFRIEKVCTGWAILAEKKFVGCCDECSFFFFAMLKQSTLKGGTD